MNTRDKLLTARKLTDLQIDGRLTSNVGSYASDHVSRAVEIAKNLPEDRDEAAAILADAARFHAIIRDRASSAVFANILREVDKQGIDVEGVR